MQTERGNEQASGRARGRASERASGKARRFLTSPFSEVIVKCDTKRENPSVTITRESRERTVIQDYANRTIIFHNSTSSGVSETACERASEDSRARD